MTQMKSQPTQNPRAVLFRPPFRRPRYRKLSPPIQRWSDRAAIFWLLHHNRHSRSLWS